MEDGRKSFRASSRVIKVSTPTVKSRYDRLVNIGFIKAVKPELDLSKANREKKPVLVGANHKTIAVAKETLRRKSREEHEGEDAMRVLQRTDKMASQKY